MSLKLTDTFAGKKVLFEKDRSEPVRIYLCGPTVYDLLHIGNFRGAVVFHLICRWLEAKGYTVEMAYNYTDVDDKIIKRAQEKGQSALDLSSHYISEFKKDFERLELRPHDYNPKVSDSMDSIIKLIAELVENKKAYFVDGEVFFEVESFPKYGKLSKKNLEELQAGQRVEVDPKKKNPFDFVLWKPIKGDEIGWDSPWGKGRPGWHIECSAMIREIFPEGLDIHGGGIDLIFPHHENEIAQGEACCSQTYSRYWIHNNFINFGREKMSKSLGNTVLARDFMDKTHPEVLKFLFFSVHYRSPMTIDDDRIWQALGALERIYLALEEAVEVEKTQALVSDANYSKYLGESEAKIADALDDDFNSAGALSVLFEVVRDFNGLKTKNGAAKLFREWIITQGKLFSLFSQPVVSFLENLQNIGLDILDVKREDVDSKIEQRMEARQEKDFETSDQIRDELAEIGIEVHDGQKRLWSISRK